MPKNEKQKQKLLYLLEILQQETDEEHRLTMAQLKEKLLAKGVTAERKSLYDDINVLREHGYDIDLLPGKNGGYCLLSGAFEVAELKLLVDAVQSSRFLTKAKSSQLISRLEKLTSRHQAGALQRSVFVGNRVKTMNESIYYSVDALHSAISRNVQITFLYFEWNAVKEKVLRHNGRRYRVSPWGLAWDSENYYLVGYSHDDRALRHYRVDKMLRLEETALPREGREQFDRFDMADYSKRVFGMYGGDSCDALLECDGSLAGVVLDRFGTDTILTPLENGCFRFTAHVLASPVFLSWVIQFGGRMKLLSPAGLQKQLCELAQSAISANSDSTK